MTIQRQSRIVMIHNMIDSTTFARFCQCCACLQAEPELKISIDEQMIPYNGENSVRQNVPKRPKKLGFKAMAELEVSLMTATSKTVCPTVSESCGFQLGD